MFGILWNRYRCTGGGMENTFHVLTLITKGQKLFQLKPNIKIRLTLAGAQTDPPGKNALIFPLNK